MDNVCGTLAYNLFMLCNNNPIFWLTGVVSAIYGITFVAHGFGAGAIGTRMQDAVTGSLPYGTRRLVGRPGDGCLAYGAYDLGRCVTILQSGLDLYMYQ